MSKTVLVTGGAGYIGSHVVRQLGESGYDIVVLDNLSSGFADAITYGELIVGDTGNMELVSGIMAKYDINAVMHFAAHTIVPESVTDPLKYYWNNTCSSRNLLQCCKNQGVKKFIFSSTAAVYGMPANGKATEDTPVAPMAPYGSSKLMTEWMLRDLSNAGDINYVALRYFNVAGSDPQSRIGQSTPNATLLIKVACEAAVGNRPSVSIFGTDYETPDGTGVRDFIHVEDLAAAHIKALEYLDSGKKSTVLNCGYGHGYSVRQVLEMVEKLHGTKLTIHEEPRRDGDIPALTAVADKIHTVLGWQPKYDNLEFIIQTSLDWEKKLARGEAYKR